LKHLSILGAAAVFSATSAVACPWAGGTYSGNELNFRTTFTVNSECSEMVFQSSGSAGFQQADKPETFALNATDKGWVTDISGVKTTLIPNGKRIEFIGPGVNRRLRVYR